MKHAQTGHGGVDSMSNEEVVLQTDDVRVRIIELAPGETTALHRHSQITDHMFGLSGEILVRKLNPDESCTLVAGDRCKVSPGRYHQVLNPQKGQTAKYLLIQGIGPYDFLTDR